MDESCLLDEGIKREPGHYIVKCELDSGKIEA